MFSFQRNEMTEPPVIQRHEEKPKQFGIRAMMVWVTLASLVMAAFAAIDLPILGVLIVCLAGTVAVAQRSRFGRRQPILASMLAGGAFLGLMASLFAPRFLLPELILTAMAGFLGGIILGFFVGVIVHALFLVFFTDIETPRKQPVADTKSTTVI